MKKENRRLIEWAAEYTASLLTSLGDRWLHVQGVVERAHYVGQAFHEDDRACLIAAAYVHDIGYAPPLKKTGFHPLDGAYDLQSYGKQHLASLVAYHSEAQYEARLRGLAPKLHQFPREYSAVTDALTYCDMTTSPTGKRVSFEERLADIFRRYDETSIVSQAVNEATPALFLAVVHTQQRLQANGLLEKVRERVYSIPQMASH